MLNQLNFLRRILKNPARRLSLKDKPSNSDELITTDIIDGTIVNPRHASSSNLNTTRKLKVDFSDMEISSIKFIIFKAYTFINTDDLTSLPDDTVCYHQTNTRSPPLLVWFDYLLCNSLFLFLLLTQ